MKKRLAIAVVLVTTVVAGYVWFSRSPNARRGHHEVTRMQNKAWVEQMFLRELRSIERSGDRVTIQFVDQRPGFGVNGANRAGEGLRSYDAPPPVAEKRGGAYLLGEGAVLSAGDYHGGSSYTIRKILADKIVVDYTMSHSIMMNSSEDSGTVELAYRTSTPLRTEGQFRDSIAEALSREVRRVRRSADGSGIEVEMAALAEFSVRAREWTESRQVFADKTAERTALAVDESFIFPKLQGWTMVTVKQVLRDKAELEYRSAYKYQGMDAEDKGKLELLYR